MGILLSNVCSFSQQQLKEEITPPHLRIHSLSLLCSPANRSWFATRYKGLSVGKKKREFSVSLSAGFFEFVFKMTASIFVGGKPIDGKLILNDDWRKVRNVFTCALRLRSIRFLRVRSNLEEGSERTTSSRNFCPL